MNNDNTNSASSLDGNEHQTSINIKDNNTGNDNSDAGFDVSVEEAVFKYVRDLNFDYNNPDNSSLNNVSNETDPDNINHATSLSPSLEWYLKDDGNFESSLSDVGNKRGLCELDELFPSKKLKVTVEENKSNVTEIDNQPQDSWMDSNFFTRDEDSSLTNSQLYSQDLHTTVSSTTNSENSQLNTDFSPSKRFQKILPKTKEVKHNYSNIIQDEPLRKRELNKLIEEISGKISQIPTSIKGQLKFAPEEDQLIKEFITRYKSIQGLTLADITHIIWHSNTFTDDSDEMLDNDEKSHKFNSEMIDLFWTSVYSILPYRLNSSIYKHVKRLYNNFDRRGKWSHEEDESLNELCTTKGLMGQWLQIGSILNRMPEDCRDRWRNYVMCQGKQKMNQWSIQEEERLLIIILNALKNKALETFGDRNIKFTKDSLLHDEELFKHAINWTQISESMGLTRSRIQCRYKWNKLFRRRMLRRINNDMDNDDIRAILLTCENKWNTVDEIDWDQLSKDIGRQWYPKELKLFFEVKGKRIKNYKNLTLKEICTKMLAQLKV
ncbi:RNA polymerase I termination factor [Monosporozyma unispora]|nr:RNA polymerase I enhancer binding protein [Kazachstania unispora]